LIFFSFCFSFFKFLYLHFEIYTPWQTFWVGRSGGCQNKASGMSYLLHNLWWLFETLQKILFVLKEKSKSWVLKLTFSWQVLLHRLKEKKLVGTFYWFICKSLWLCSSQVLVSAKCLLFNFYLYCQIIA